MHLKNSVSSKVTPLLSIAQIQSIEEELMERRIHLRTMKKTSSKSELKRNSKCQKITKIKPSQSPILDRVHRNCFLNRIGHIILLH